MNERFSIRNLSQDGAASRLQLHAGNGVIAATIEFSVALEDLKLFATALSTFPHYENDDACFEVGSELGKTSHVYLRAYALGATGGAALEVLTDNRCGPPDHARTHFSLRCEVASLNEIGRQLLSWIEKPKRPFEWKAGK